MNIWKILILKIFLKTFIMFLLNNWFNAFKTVWDFSEWYKIHKLNSDKYIEVLINQRFYFMILAVISLICQTMTEFTL